MSQSNHFMLDKSREQKNTSCLRTIGPNSRTNCYLATSSQKSPKGFALRSLPQPQVIYGLTTVSYIFNMFLFFG